MPFRSALELYPRGSTPPTPDKGTLLYSKADGKVYTKTKEGAEVDITSGGSYKGRWEYGREVPYEVGDIVHDGSRGLYIANHPPVGFLSTINPYGERVAVPVTGGIDIYTVEGGDSIDVGPVVLKQKFQVTTYTSFSALLFPYYFDAYGDEGVTREFRITNGPDAPDWDSAESQTVMSGFYSDMFGVSGDYALLAPGISYTLWMRQTGTGSDEIFPATDFDYEDGPGIRYQGNMMVHTASADGDATEFEDSGGVLAFYLARPRYLWAPLFPFVSEKDAEDRKTWAPYANYGDMAYDWALEKPLWYNGNVWVDATGTPVD